MAFQNVGTYDLGAIPSSRPASPAVAMSDAAVSSDSGSEDWDALLDSYEEYVDSYVSMLQKASAGDMSAMTESASFLQKSQELTKKLSSATSGMSVSQVNRYNQINQKMLQAAQNMH